MMKKIICIFLSLFLLVFCACSPENNMSDELLQQYLDHIEEFKTPIRQVGAPASYIVMGDVINIGILYPETAIYFLDEAILDWVETTAESTKKEVKGKKLEKDAAELTVSYDSYRAADGFVSVKMSGSFISPHLAHPVDLIQTFMADLEKRELIKLSDVLKEDKIQSFKDLVIQTAGVAPENADENLLQYSVLTSEGIEITLNRGDYLAMSEGTKTMFFPYDDIKEFLSGSFAFGEAESAPPEKAEVKNEIAQKVPADGSRPMLALTFDDGPSAHTERLLNLFAQHGGKGTFYVLGNLIDARPSLLQRMVAEGHEIGNHSWSHRQMTQLDKQELVDQIMMTQAKIYDVTGVKPETVRPPYGAIDDSVRAVGKELGVSFVNWSVDTLDWKTKNARAIYNEIINNASNGAIILCHDLHKTTVDAMETVIPKLIADGYQLVTVSELLSSADAPLEAGKLYYRR